MLVLEKCVRYSSGQTMLLALVGFLEHMVYHDHMTFSSSQCIWHSDFVNTKWVVDYTSNDRTIYAIWYDQLLLSIWKINEPKITPTESCYSDAEWCVTHVIKSKNQLHKVTSLHTEITDQALNAGLYFACNTRYMIRTYMISCATFAVACFRITKHEARVFTLYAIVHLSACPSHTDTVSHWQSCGLYQPIAWDSGLIVR